MRALFCGLIFLFCLSPVNAEQYVTSQGQKIVTFDIPGLEHTGTREKKTTRTTFKQKIGNGNLQLLINTKRWLKLQPELAYRDERNVMRESQTARLREPVEVPGAAKVLMYTSTKPYNALVVVLFTRDFRCQFTVTGTRDAKEEMGPTYERLLKTLRVLPKHERE